MSIPSDFMEGTGEHTVLKTLAIAGLVAQGTCCAAFGATEETVRTLIYARYKGISEKLPSDDLELLTESELDFCVEMAMTYAGDIKIDVNGTALTDGFSMPPPR